MLAIISNLKFCHKFFTEENFEKLSDSEFAQFEENLERTEQLIEAQRQTLMLRLLSANKASKGSPLNDALDSLDQFSNLVSQFWSQEISPDFATRLDQAARTSLLGG